MTLQTFPWQAVSAVCAAVLLIAGVFAVWLRLALGEFENKLFERLEKRFPIVDGCNERHAAIDRRLHVLEMHAGFLEPEGS